MAKKKKGGPAGGAKSGQLVSMIKSVFEKEPGRVFNYKQLSARLAISDPHLRRQVGETLKEMKKNGILHEVQAGRFRLKQQGATIRGTVDMTRMGYAFIISDDIEEDVFVSNRNLNTALHGDKVKVRLLVRRKGNRPEGEVMEISERARETFVGTVEVMPQFAFLIPDTKGMPFDLFIPGDKLKGAKQGEKAVARITQWDRRQKNPVAEIVEVLGMPGEHETEIHSILAEFELPYKFDESHERIAEEIKPGVTEEEIKRRRDFRKIATFTIDPADAKDFDDALSLRKIKEGVWEVGVHIADVTHYVKPESILEKEALKRGTSVYLVDRVVPMLPEQLSNNVCSLSPNTDKLTYSAVFEMNEKAEVLSQWMGRTVINSDKRFSYQEAQQVIDSGDGPMKDELLFLHGLAQKLRAGRFDCGALSFERTEVSFDLDEKGYPVSIRFRESGTANQLIEEFMLLANKKVAELIGKKGGDKAKTFVYRIHDKPDPVKIQSFRTFIKRFGYRLDNSSENKLAQSMNSLLKEVNGKKEQNIIETLALRSMAKAVYSTNNIGHYGLSFRHYTHFTSPIRRYPDMMVHRLLTAYMNGEKSKDEEQYERLCEHSSKRERLAVEAERASIKYKQVEFMQDKMGIPFEGVISGVTEWGIYVELIENQCEGMVHIRELDDDFYEYDEDNYCIRGRHSGKEFTLGNPVTVEVVKADLVKKQLDFVLLEPENKKEK
ncbi:MAG: ribonuclease R [Marinilabiliaceae bacterium]|jgi:ribonuclease R|nr:ribonuclease R [Marinilabiliaceae bacterium]